MKKILLLLCTLLTTAGAWAETITWESKSGWTQASGGKASLEWFGVTTPGSTTTQFTLTEFQIMHEVNASMIRYIAIATDKSTSSLSESAVVAVSNNSVTPSAIQLYTYTFDNEVTLQGGTTYYIVFLTSNVASNGAYTVGQGRIALNHTSYGTYAPGCSYASGGTWWPYYKAELTSTVSMINVTYNLYEADGATLVGSEVASQETNSAVAIPASLTGSTYFDYATEGSIGDTDCTIKVTRTPKDGIVYPISNLSNNKAYQIVVPRGTYTTVDGNLANTVKNSSYAINNFALLNYEDNYYMWSIADSKFVAGSGNTLSDTPAVITFSASTIPSYQIKSGSNTLNATSGQTTGAIFDTWDIADDGNCCFIYEVEDFDPTDALAALDAYFHPSVSVTYVISDENGVVFTSEAIATSVGETITALPSNLQRPFCSYSEINQTMADGENTVNVTVTYDLPFEVGTDKLYYATLRGHYVYYSADNSDVRTNQSSKENTDAYKWSFEGNPYDGIKVKNAASGTYLTNTASTVQLTEDGFAWTIDRLNDTSTFGLKNGSNYINEQNHSNHNLIYWTQFTNDTGSQWNVEEVAEGEALYEEVIAQLEAINFGTGLGQYGLVIEEIDYTSQAAEIISSLKAKGYTEVNLTKAEQMLASYSLNMPSAGFYRIKGKTSSKYLAADFATNNKFAMTDATDATTVFYFDGSHLVNLSSGMSNGMTTSAWAWVLGENASTVAFHDGLTGGGYAIESGAAYFYDNGDGTGSADRGGNLTIAGANPRYTSWALEEVTEFPVTISAAGYATLCAPVALTVPSGVTANTVTINADGVHLDLTSVGDAIPAGTPVILEGAEGSYNFAVTSDVPDINQANVLTGVTAAIAAPDGSYILQNQEAGVGFYQVDITEAAPNVPGFRAYIPAQGGEVKAFLFGDDIATGVKSVSTAAGNQTIFNLAGQRVEKAQKGIYIVGGKKTVVK